MKDYYQRSMKALQLAGMSERTQECYNQVNPKAGRLLR